MNTRLLKVAVAMGTTGTALLVAATEAYAGHKFG